MVLLAVMLIAYIAHFWYLVKGVIVGITSVAQTLIRAYYTDWRNKKLFT